jgi:hypothetical protein
MQLPALIAAFMLAAATQISFESAPANKPPNVPEANYRGAEKESRK